MSRKYLTEEEIKIERKSKIAEVEFENDADFLYMCKTYEKVAVFINSRIKKCEIFDALGNMAKYCNIEFEYGKLWLTIVYNEEQRYPIDVVCTKDNIANPIDILEIYEDFKITSNGKYELILYISTKRNGVFVNDIIGSAIIDNYKEYLKTKHWEDARKYFYEIYGNKCCLCSKKDVELNLHHNNYENLWHETIEDVVVLCKDCHSKFHNN